MFAFLKNHIYPIGIDTDDGVLKVAQMKRTDKTVNIVSCASEQLPARIQPGNSDWQRWSVQALRDLTANNGFKGREVITMLPADDVFIDQIKLPKMEPGRIKAEVMARLSEKLTFEANDALVKYVVANAETENAKELDVLVMATQRAKVDMYLAMYEKANLSVKSIHVWPFAMISSYINFFGRRKADENSVVMLLQMQPGWTNIVMCRHKNLLFARRVPIGYRGLDSDEMWQRLLAELSACSRYFESVSGSESVQRLIFFSSHSAGTEICGNIVRLAQHLQIPAQLGDVLAAINVCNREGVIVERRGSTINWASAFGLSLS